MLKRLITAVSIILFPASTNAVADECLKIASDSKNIKAVRLFTPGVKQVFQNAQLCAEYINMPSKRIQKAMSEGEIDGEFIRVNTYLKAMKDYIAPVPTPIVRASGVIVTLRKEGFLPQTIADIGKKKIGTILGFKWHEVFAVALASTKVAKKYETLAAMLNKRRIDGFLIEDVSLQRLYAEKLLSPEDIHVSPAIIDLSAYLVMNRKHSGIVGKLDSALKKAKADGAFKVTDKQN